MNEFNDRAHWTISGTKYSTTGAESEVLKDKIVKQIPSDPRKTKQLHSVQNISVGERTEIYLNLGIDDGITMM